MKPLDEGNYDKLEKFRRKNYADSSNSGYNLYFYQKTSSKQAS